MRSLFLGAQPVYRFEHSTNLIDQVSFTEKGVKEVLKKNLNSSWSFGQAPLLFFSPGATTWLSQLIIGSLSNDNGDGNGKKAIGLDKQNNSFARASRFFVHFVAVVARP